MPGPAKVTDLAGYGSALLAAFQSSLAGLGVALPVTDQQAPIAYPAPGPTIAFVSPALVVNFVSIRSGSAGTPQSGYVHPSLVLSTVEYAVSLLRTTAGWAGSGFDVAAPAELLADFEVFTADASALWRASLAILQDLSAAGLDPGVPFVVAGVDSINPQGGIGGNRLSLSVTAL